MGEADLSRDRISTLLTKIKKMTRLNFDFLLEIEFLICRRRARRSIF